MFFSLVIFIFVLNWLFIATNLSRAHNLVCLAKHNTNLKLDTTH